MTHQIPESWLITTIDAVVKNTTQRAPEGAEKFTYIDISSIDRTKKQIVSPQNLLGKDAPSRARKTVQTGDVLVSMTRPNMNAVALVPEHLNNQIASTGFDVLRANKIDTRWLFYLVRTYDFVSKMSDKVQGALYPAISSKIVREYEIPLAPINEQKRIADKLDTLLAAVDSCRARLDKVPTLIKRFRQSVLAAAISGSLTEEWRNDAEFQTFETKFSELIQDSVVGLVRSAAQQYKLENDTTPYLKMNNISESWGYSLDSLVGVQCSQVESYKYQLKKGDWLFNTRNSMELVGKSCVWQGEPAVFNNNILRVRFKKSVLSEYVEIWFRSPLGREQLEKVKSSTTSVAAIYQRSLLAQKLSLPTLTEQIEIVRRVDALFAIADKLEDSLATVRKRVDQLTPAILAKAFRGELVAQDQSDEPASALLARIADTAAPKRAVKKAA